MTATEANQHVKSVYASSKYWISGTIIVCMAVAMLLGLMIAAAIATPLRRLAEEVDKVTGGDLRLRPTQKGKDEIGQLAGAFSRMAENFRTMIGKIEDASNRVMVTSSQVYSSSERMATGAEEVASQAATVATASEEMAATSGDIAQNCSMAAEAAQAANKKAVDDEKIVETSVQVMNKIAAGIGQRQNCLEPRFPF